MQQSLRVTSYSFHFSVFVLYHYDPIRKLLNHVRNIQSSLITKVRTPTKMSIDGSDDLSAIYSSSGVFPHVVSIFQKNVIEKSVYVTQGRESLCFGAFIASENTTEQD